MPTIEPRKSSTGSPSYRVRVRIKGQPEVSQTFTTEAEASKFAKGVDFAIRQGLYVPPEKGVARTVGELIDAYVAKVACGESAGDRQRRAKLAWWKAKLGTLPLTGLTPAKISHCRDELLAQPTGRKAARAPGTVNRYLAPLSHALSMAMKEWGWVEDNPMRRVRKLKEPRGRCRTLSKVEVMALLEACRQSRNPHIYRIALIAVSTGMRLGEISGLRKTHVDLDRGRITLEYTKNGERRVVPVVGPALVALQEAVQAAGQGGLLFPGRNPKAPTDIHPAFHVVLKRAGIQDFRFHDLRHCASSFLLESGASLGQLAEVLGHKTLQMVKRYSHLSESGSARLIETMNDALFSEV